MTTHYLKLHDRYFDAVKNGFKRFEIRKNDRDFRVGDLLILTRFYDKQIPDNPMYVYTRDSEKINAKVTYLLKHEDFPDGIPEGYVVMTIEVF
jgi:ASC-1-like (ASCH) protein